MEVWPEDGKTRVDLDEAERFEYLPRGWKRPIVVEYVYVKKEGGDVLVGGRTLGRVYAGGRRAKMVPSLDDLPEDAARMIRAALEGE